MSTEDVVVLLVSRQGCVTFNVRAVLVQILVWIPVSPSLKAQGRPTRITSNNGDNIRSMYYISRITLYCACTVSEKL
jgi:hypothetical protein